MKGVMDKTILKDYIDAVALINETEEDMKIWHDLSVFQERKKNAESIKRQVEQWMSTIPMRMQRIIRFYFFEQLNWEETADRLGGRATGESVRKEFERFMSGK